MSKSPSPEPLQLWAADLLTCKEYPGSSIQIDLLVKL